MKRLILFAAVIFALPVNGQEKATQGQRNSDYAKNAEGHIAETPPIHCGDVTVMNAALGDQQQYREKNQPQSYLSALVAPNNLPTDAVVLVAAVGLLFAWQTVKANRDSARAALAQANHIRASDRAWMIAKMDKPHILAEGPWAYAGIPKLANQGNTPAFVYEIGNAAIFLPKGQPLPESPAGYESKNVFKVEGRGIPIAPSGQVGRPIITATYSAHQILTEQLILWVFGYMKYRDVFSNEERETRYCFRLIPCPIGGVDDHNFVIDGPPAYNQAT